MKYILIFIIILFYSIKSNLIAQEETFTIKLANFSTDEYDEFSPVYFDDGIIFCSNLVLSSWISYETAENKKLYNICFIPLSDSAKNSEVKLFSKDLFSKLNDGPVSLNKSGDIIYFSRNNDIKTKLRNIFNKNNTLGIFTARKENDKWIDVKEFKYNNKEYSLVTPFISRDEQRLYFASDKDGGYGGVDLYYCDLEEGEWSEPKNMGDVINTRGNESYPYIDHSGNFYFSSDGHKGFGGKDIFFSVQENGDWTTPVNLKKPINSESDDFAFVMNESSEEGFLSSSRNSSDDIFHVIKQRPFFFDCDSMKENYNCFLFYDETANYIDTLPVKYMWDFGDGSTSEEFEAEHCYDKPGTYLVKLNIIDNITGNTFFTQASYKVEITEHIQAFITAPDAAIRNKSILFNSRNTNLPQISDKKYVWDFGDGFNQTGEEITHFYESEGVYSVKLGVYGKRNEKGLDSKSCVIKNITIVKDNQELALFNSMDKDEWQDLVELIRIENEENLELNEDSLSHGVEKFDSVNSVFNHVVQKEFNRVQIKSYILGNIEKDKKEIIKKELAKLDTSIFVFDTEQVSVESHFILDKIIEILKKNLPIKIEIATHTHNIGSWENNVILSQKRARSIVNYLLSKGIESDRVSGKGYGESRPIARNNTETGRKMNHRIEFIILKD